MFKKLLFFFEKQKIHKTSDVHLNSFNHLFEPIDAY